MKINLTLREHERFWLLKHKVAKTTTAEVQTPFLGPQRELGFVGGEANIVFLPSSKSSNVFGAVTECFTQKALRF